MIPRHVFVDIESAAALQKALAGAKDALGCYVLVDVPVIIDIDVVKQVYGTTNLLAGHGKRIGDTIFWLDDPQTKQCIRMMAEKKNGYWP